MNGHVVSQLLGTIKSVENCIDTIFMWDIKVEGLNINGC